YRARYYGPGVGRFRSEDPAAFSAGDDDPYRYVFNRPVRVVDPSGIDPESRARIIDQQAIQQSMNRPNGSWPADWYWNNFFAVTSHKPTFDKGCVGLCQLRCGCHLVPGYVAPPLPQNKFGTVFFSNLPDALAYQKSLKQSVLVAIQFTKPIAKPP